MADVSYDPTEVSAFESFRESENIETEVESPQVEVKNREEENNNINIFQNFFEEDDEEEGVDVQVAQEPAYRSQYKPPQRENAKPTKNENQNAVHPYLPLETETVPVSGSYEEETVVEEIDEESVIRTRRRNENALYLTKMLTNEEDQFTKIKVCIVQDGESLETISARYEVPISTILRRNRLDSDSINDGQVLYIPVKN